MNLLPRHSYERCLSTVDDGPTTGERDLDAGVDDAAAVAGGERHHRIEIELGDLRNGFGQSGHAQHDLAERLHVGGGAAAIALQQRKPASFAQELVGIVVGEWGDAESHVAENFHVRAAEPESHQRRRTADRRSRRRWFRRRR